MSTAFTKSLWNGAMLTVLLSTTAPASAALITQTNLVSNVSGLAAITDVAMRRLFSPEFQADHPDLMAGRRAAFLRTDPEVFRAACDALAALDLRPELGNVRVPVLVLVGEHDEATPPPMSLELAAGLPQARFDIIPGCAHVPQLQSPYVFLDAIGDFLSSPKLRAVAS